MKKTKKTERPRLTISQRVQIAYSVLLDISSTFVWSEPEARRLEQVFRGEIGRQIKNHSRDLINDLIKHYESLETTFVARTEIIGLLKTVQKYTGPEPEGDYCSNCDRPLEDHGTAMFGDVSVRVCFAMPGREMIVVGYETAKIISERMAMKLPTAEEGENGDE